MKQRSNMGRRPSRAARCAALALACWPIAQQQGSAQADPAAPMAADAGTPAFDDVPQLLNPGRIPSGGGLVIQSLDYDPVIEVTIQGDPPTQVLPGQLSMLHGFYVWVADVPLAEGRYTVVLTGMFGGQSTASIEVIAPIADEKPRLVAEPSASLITEGIERECCDLWTGAQLLIWNGACFFQAQQDRIELSLGLSTPESTALMGQYLFRVQSHEHGADDGRFWPWNDLRPLLYTEQAERYCYGIEAVDVVRGTMHVYDELDACAAHGDFPALEIRPTEPPSSALEAQVCNAPPVQHQAAWCTLNAPSCEAADAGAGADRIVPQEPCALEAYVCDGAPLPGTVDQFFGAPAFDAGVDAGEPVTAGDGGDGEARDASVAARVDAGRPDEASPGCSVASSAGAARAPHVLACLFLLFAVRRRRR